MASSKPTTYENASRSLRQIKRQFNTAADSLKEAVKSNSEEAPFLMDSYLKELKELKSRYFENTSLCIEALDRSNETKTAAALVTEETLEKDLDSILRTTCDLEGKVRCAQNKTKDNSNRDSILNSSFYCQGHSKPHKPKFEKLELPKFDGNWKNWMAFKELYLNLVHTDSNLTNIQKLTYLKQCMVSEAEKYLKDVHLKDDAYTPAWNRLIARFDNKCAITKAYFKTLFAIEKIKYDSSLPQLVDDFDLAVRNLKAAGESTGNWSSILVYMLYTKLDPRTQREFENSLEDNSKFFSYKMVANFITKRALMVEERETDRKSNKVTEGKRTFMTTKDSNEKGSLPCFVCNNFHKVLECEKFRTMNPSQRWEVIREKKVCANCFYRGHLSKDCNNKKSCKTCQKKHHTLLHQTNSSMPTNPTSFANEKSEAVNKTSGTVDLNVSKSKKRKTILLPTATVEFQCRHTKGLARILLDSCTQATLVSQTFIRRWKIPTSRSPEVMSLNSVGGPRLIDSTCSILLKSRITKFTLDIEADIVPATSLTYRVQQLAIPDLCGKLKSLKVADLAWTKSELNIPCVDILLGAEYYEKCLNPERQEINGTFLHSTQFGWIVTGPVSPPLSVMLTITNNPLNQSCSTVETLLQKFWDIENVESENQNSQEEDLCNLFFEKTVIQDSEGKFVVKLPLKGSISDLKSNLAQAIACLNRLENSYDCETFQKYSEFMEEYEFLGHMSIVPEAELSKPAYYIPHHAVFRPQSQTTKLRVVFNASSKTRTGLSLNDILMKGPSIQPELFDIIIRWRCHPYAFCADISKMYRNILVHPDDRDLQRIVWRKTKSEPIKIYRLNTVTYGTTSASFLATKCLSVLGHQLKASNPTAAQAILSDFYMDDLITGADSIDKLVKIRETIHTTLLAASLPLRKYMANQPPVLATVNPADIADSNFLQFSNNLQSISVLGLTWNPKEDLFQIKTNLRESDIPDQITKRIILSQVSRTFDPIGFISPITIRAKIILQSLWRESLKWDDPVSHSLAELYRKYVRDLQLLSKFKIRRPYFLYSEVQNNESHSSLILVGFSDASEKAYCACVYVCKLPSNPFESYLVCAKTKVAPLKMRTIPQLELEAALLLSKLLNRVRMQLSINLKNVFAFSDSQVVLGWLNTKHASLHIFERNRVCKISNLVPIQAWSYVESKINPADLATRGISVNLFLKNEIWLQGPSNVFVYIYRFLYFKCKPCSLVPTLEEIKLAESAVIKLIQQFYYQKEIDKLRNALPLPANSPLQALNPMLDKSNILRVGGRIRNARFSYEKRHPIILPAKSHLVQIYIRYVHQKYFHATRSFTMNFVLSRFWVIGGLKNVAKRIIFECTICKRYQGTTANQLMGDLPMDRISISRPFSIVGVDFTGHFMCKCVKHRSVKYSKIYAAIFVCFSTRAVHIEVVSDLTTEAFFNTLKRFTARRGLPSTIYSDNGLNFVGTSNFFLANQSELMKYAHSENFAWKFIPPRTPHCGGLWESAVKSAKYHLKRVTREQPLDFEEYATLFAQIEAILNSRPLSYRSINNTDFEPITPGHFIAGDSLLSVPEPENPNLKHLKLSRRYTLLQQLLNSFWIPWKKDYLNQLQQRGKQKQARENIKSGNVVLIKNPGEAPTNWVMGRIKDVLPDAKGLVRHALVSLGPHKEPKKFHIQRLIVLCYNATYRKCNELDFRSPEKYCKWHLAYFAFPSFILELVEENMHYNEFAS